jgi:hypothetical protein
MNAEFFDNKMSGEPDAEPVIENPRRPMMTDRPPRPRKIGGKVLEMADDPKPPKGSRNRMDPLPKRAPRPRGQRLPLDDQTEARPPRRPPARRPSYVRMRVRLEAGSLSVQDIQRVEGPLVADEELHGDLAYEVTVGGRRVASGSVPDVGVARAFPHPDPAPGQEGHQFVPALTHDVIVRVPSDAVSLRALPRVDVALYRLKEGPLPKADDDRPLTARFTKELREVARLRGIELDALPQDARAEARRALT